MVRGASFGRLGNRIAARLCLQLDGRLDLASNKLGITLENVSRTGAGIRTDAKLTPGASCLLKIGNIEIFSAVAWTRAGRSGLTFERPLSKEQLETLQLAAEDPDAFELQELRRDPRLWR
jgi:hypothetical protein